MRRACRAGLGVLLAGVVVGPATVATADPAALSDLRSSAARSRDEQLRAARDYQESLERLLVHRERELARAVEHAERTRALAGQGLVARYDADTAERAATAARARLDATRNESLVAASLVAKTLALEELASTPAPPPGGEQATATLIRHQGTRPWALALTARLQDFFARAFGRPLPVSAYGQTSVHDRLGFDHRNAVDVALHPDSDEGRALMEWLRRAGLSFIGFRGAMAGVATGAHIHVGEPSQRLASP
jgi:hypothetical protein